LKKSGFHKIDVWAKTFESFKNLLAEGETVYGEIVGFEETDKPIMAPHNNEKAGEGSKELVKKYGKTMLYRYGQSKGSSGFYVYRITQQRPGCTPIELTEVQYRARAKELGLFCVPHIQTIHSFDGNYEALQKLVEGLSDGPSVLDGTHIKEGVVVRIEAQDGTTDWMKLKGFTFRVLEGIVKNDANYVDTEEAA
jgi:hypothetical protein